MYNFVVRYFWLAKTSLFTLNNKQILYSFVLFTERKKTCSEIILTNTYLDNGNVYISNYFLKRPKFDGACKTIGLFLSSS